MTDDDNGPRQSRTGSAGIGFLGILAAGLTILFVYLKLTHQIGWAWWQVFLPAIIYLFGGLCCCCPVLIIIGVIAGTAVLATVGLGWLSKIVDWIKERLPGKK